MSVVKYALYSARQYHSRETNKYRFCLFSFGLSCVADINDAKIHFQGSFLPCSLVDTFSNF